MEAGVAMTPPHDDDDDGGRLLEADSAAGAAAAAAAPLGDDDDDDDAPFLSASLARKLPHPDDPALGILLQDLVRAGEVFEVR